MLARKLTVVVALAALGLGACGSSSKSAGSTSPTVAGAAGSQSSAGDTSTTAAPSSANNGGGGGGGGDFCALLRKDQAAFAGSDIATKTPSDLKKLYSDVVPEIEKAESKAPDAIKADFATLVTNLKTLVKALDDAGYDVTKVDPNSFKDLADPKFEAASQRISTYVEQSCGIKAG